MWLFGIDFDIYSKDMNRRIFIVKRDNNGNHAYRGNIGKFIEPKFSKRRWKPDICTLVEEWHTPESQGDTGDWEYYTFMAYQDAAVFIAKLCMKLNSPQQRRLMQVAENLVTDITKEHKKATKQLEAAEKKKNIASKKKTV